MFLAIVDVKRLKNIKNQIYEDFLTQHFISCSQRVTIKCCLSLSDVVIRVWDAQDVEKGK